MHIHPFATRQLIVAAACMAACMASSAAFADCTLRATRPAETAFNSRAMAALVAALPPLPAGVVEVDAKPYDFKQALAIREVLCEGTKEGEFSVTARRQYIRKHSESERRQLQAQYDALTAQFHALNKTPPDKAAEQQTLRQQSNAAWQAMRDAEKAGDKTAAKVSDEKYRSLRNQADAIDAQHEASVKPQTRELDQRRIAIDLVSQKVDIVIGMNLQRLPMASDRAVVGSHGTASPGKGVGLKVHNVAWSAVGADGPLRQALAAAIDRGRLQALVGRPLPQEAESEAVAAKATPTVVPDMPAGAGAGTGTGAATAIAPASTSTSTSITTKTTTTTATPGSTRTTATERAEAAPATAPAPPPAAPPAAPAVVTPPAEPVKKAAEAVNLLRGLLGR